MVSISSVYRALTGTNLRQTGQHRFRACAVFRGGDGFNLALDDSRGVWHDFVTNDGGGILDLIVRVRGGTRESALMWLADYACIALDDRPPSTEDPKRWARERAEEERIRTEAKYFADAAALLAEWALDELCETDPERAVQTALITALRVSPDAEYRFWLERSPDWAAALVQVGRERDRRLQIALAHWIAAGLPEVARAV